MNKILASIVTPAFNSSLFIEDCIRSIKGQTYDNIEHIIIDGGSTDGTIDIIKKYEGTYSMIWLSEPDNGMYDAINKGFALSKGEIMAYLNSDDMYMPWAVELVVAAFKKYKHVDWITGIPGKWNKNGIYYSLPGKIPVYYRNYINKGYYHGRGLGFIQQESTFWRRSLWGKAGVFNSNLKLAGDFFLWKSFAEHAELYTLNVVLAGFRKHEEQKSSNISEYYKEISSLVNVGLIAKILYRLLAIIAVELFSINNYLRKFDQTDEYYNKYKEGSLKIRVAYKIINGLINVSFLKKIHDKIINTAEIVED